MGQISIEKMSWTFNLFLSSQSKEEEKALFHHFGAETQGFQGLLTRVTEGKIKSLKNDFL